MVARRVERREPAVGDPGRLHVLPAARGRHGCARSRSPPTTSTTSCRSRATSASAQRIWTASKEIGRPLKPGLVELQKLRNQVAREMGYSSFFALQVADYGMTRRRDDDAARRHAGDDEAALRRPALLGARTQLAERYKRPGAQADPGALDRQPLGAELAGARRGRQPRSASSRATSPENIVKSAESFYVSLGFAKLPPSFWKKSDLYPVPPGVARKKNAHASAWHIDHGHDVRSLMSVQAERAVVRHQPPRARPHLLFPLVQPARGAVPAARGREPRVPRGDRRAGASWPASRRRI